MKKTIAALCFALAAPFASAATPFYIDVGNDFSSSTSDNGSTATDWLTELTYTYISQTKFYDTDTSGGISVGDSVVTTGGVTSDFNSLAFNYVTGSVPGSFLTDTNDGFGTSGDWGLTFTINDLEGTVASVGSDGPILDYTSGSISIYYYDNTMSSTAELIQLFDIIITNSTDDSAGLGLSGYVTNFDAGGVGSIGTVAVGDVFNTAKGSFENWVNVDLGQLFSDIHFDTTTDGLTQTGGIDSNGAYIQLEGQHDGSLTFEVPEPGSLAIMGLGLLGVAGVARRKRAQ